MYRIGIATLTVVVAGCTVSGPDPMLAVGMPSPASFYCIERGGTLDIQEHADGNVTMCVLSDGTRIEEWKLYRRDHPQE